MKQASEKSLCRSEADSSTPNSELLGQLLRDGRRLTSMTVEQLSRNTGVAVEEIQNAEAGIFTSVRVLDLMAICNAVKVKVLFRPAKTKTARTNREILEEFDSLLESGRARVFLTAVPDKEHAALTWNVVGDPDRNWLYVVVANPRRNVRYGAVTSSAGSWSIAGQLFGLDAETHLIAEEMSKHLFNKYRHALLIHAEPK